MPEAEVNDDDRHGIPPFDPRDRRDREQHLAGDRRGVRARGGARGGDLDLPADASGASAAARAETELPRAA